MTAGRERVGPIVRTLALVVLVLWALGMLGAVGGPAVHLLLVLAAVLGIAAWRSGRA